MKNVTRIAVAGDSGSFSEEAGLQYARENRLTPEIIFAIHMEGVLSALDRKGAEIGIFPVHNTLQGIVQPAFEAMGKHDFRIIGQLRLQIIQCLLSKKGKKLSDIKKVASYIVARNQCGIFLQKNLPHAEFVEALDTGRAARDLAEGTLSADTAVIASSSAAKVYGLKVLVPAIQDDPQNLTTFIAVKK